MMAFLKKSLSEDSADHYSHTWAFLLLFLLSIITLFVPLSPLIQLTKPTGTHRNIVLDNVEYHDPTEAKIDSKTPHYKASCWTPAQFTASHVMYTNAVCAAVLNSLIQGRNFSEARLYEPPTDEIPISPDSESRSLRVEDFPQAPKSIEESDKEIKKQSSDKDNEQNEKFQAELEFLHHKREKVHSDIQELVIYKTPLFLFLLAICLRLPHAIWSLLSNCCSCVNVNQTLASAQTSLAMDTSHRQKLREDLAMSLGKSNRRGTSLVYLLMKLLMVVVVCVEIIVVCHCLLVESDKLENDLDTIRIMNEALGTGFKNKKMDIEHHVTSQNTTYTDYIYLCRFNIRRMQNIQDFTVQCLFNMDNGKAPDENSMENNEDNDEVTASQPLGNIVSDVDDNILFMYKGLYTIVLAMLIILAFLNIISLMAWLLKLLLASCRPFLGLKTDASMDVVFLVSMAWNNTSAVVATELAKYSPWSEQDGHERVKQNTDDN